MAKQEMMSHPHDAVIRLSNDQIHTIVQGVNDVVKETVEKGDPEYAFGFGDALTSAGQAAWVALAHLAYEMSEKWGTDELPSDDDFVTVAAFRWNKSPETIRRHVEIWKWVIQEPDHPGDRLDALFSKPMQGLWYIKQAAKEGQLEEEHWLAIEEAPDISSLHEIAKGVRGEYGRAKDALKIMLEKDGTLKARRKGAYEIIGVLNVQDQSKIVTEAIERIENKSGIFRR